LTDILISGGTVVTMDNERRVIKNGSIAVEDNKIVELGEADDMKKKYKTDRIHRGR